MDKLNLKRTASTNCIIGVSWDSFLQEGAEEKNLDQKHIECDDLYDK